MAAGVNLVLPAAAIVVLGRRIVMEPYVSGRTVLGLLSVYLLIGMTFAATFIVIAVVSGEPFFVQTDHAQPVDFTYFSFVTLATVGYGDFTAANPMPRMLAAIEGLSGQLYLVTVVAVAVSRVSHETGSVARRLTLEASGRRHRADSRPKHPVLVRPVRVRRRLPLLDDRAASSRVSSVSTTSCRLRYVEIVDWITAAGGQRH